MANRQFQGLLEALTTSLPDNVALQDQLSGLITKKSSYIKRLQIIWDNRTKPDLTEQDIREINLNFQPTQPENEITSVVRGGSGIQTVDSRSWILKTRDCWKGFDPVSQTYFTKNIFFGGEIDWDTYFNCLMISDHQSKSINLIHTIQSFIEKGSAMGLSDPDWIQVFLLLGKKYLPLIFPSLSRQGNNLDALFTELISNVNQETEIAKLRSALSEISRKANEQVQISLFRVK